ncbi:MAG: tyrosine-protein phosphatase [Gaiellaceae bacterium]
MSRSSAEWIPSTASGSTNWSRAATRGGRDAYLDLLDRYRPEFARALSAVAAADGPVVMHCTAGKDRTGLVVALLLRVAGVPMDVVADDWAQSLPNMAHEIEA